MVKIEEANGPLEESRLITYETDWGFCLPGAYRAFLLAHNGGYPAPDVFRFKGRDTGSSVDRFLGIGVGTYDNLIEYVKAYRNRIPPSLLPIAHDPGGNLICIGISGSDCGKVFFWDHEQEADEGEEVDFSNLTLIAETFTEFIDGLYELHGPAATPRADV